MPSPPCVCFSLQAVAEAWRLAAGSAQRRNDDRRRRTPTAAQSVLPLSGSLLLAGNALLWMSRHLHLSFSVSRTLPHPPPSHSLKHHTFGC